MYSKIVNPKTGRRVSITSRLGKEILRNYLSVLVGGVGGEEFAPTVNGLEEGGGYIPIGKMGRTGGSFFVLYKNGNVLKYNIDKWEVDEDLTTEIQTALEELYESVSSKKWGIQQLLALHLATFLSVWKKDDAWERFYPSVHSRLRGHITATEQNATRGILVGRLAGQLKGRIEGIFREGLIAVETNSAEFSILLDWWKERMVGAVTDDLVDLTALADAAASEVEVDMLATDEDAAQKSDSK
jgi:hypothetical protein